MILYREICWWYCAVTAVLLIVGLTGRFEAFYLAIVLSAVQVVHFRLHHGNFSGTPAQVLFGYCTLARCLSLLPWSRREPLSGDLLRRAFLSPPVKGSVMQGLPAAR